MARVTLDIAGRPYGLMVKDGQEAHFERLARIVDAKAQAVGGAIGGVNEARQLLMAALLLADELGDRAPAAPMATDAPPPPPPVVPAGLAGKIEALAVRLERLAARFDADGGAA